jgi:hypothetical protein
MLPSQFNRLIDTVRSLFEREVQQASDKQESAVRNAANACGEKEREQRITIARAVIGASRTVPEYEKTQRRKEHSLQWKMLWVTLFAAVAAAAAAVGAIYYAGIAARQLDTTNKTYCEMRQQTEMFHRQLEATTAAIITRQFRMTWPTKQVFLSVIVNNRGRVAGTKIQAHFHLAKVSLPTERVIGAALPDWEFAIPEIEAAPEVPPEIGIFLNIGKEELNGIGIPKAIKLTGTFSYFNGFHDHSESVCYYILGGEQLLEANGTVYQSSQPGAVVSCDGLPAQIAWYRDAEEKYIHDQQQRH